MLAAVGGASDAEAPEAVDGSAALEREDAARASNLVSKVASSLSEVVVIGASEFGLGRLDEGF